MTAEEEHLAGALSILSPIAGDLKAMLSVALKSIGYRPNPADLAALQRMQLEAPSNFKERIYRALLLGAMASRSPAEQ